MSLSWDRMLRRQLDYAEGPLTRHRLLMAHLDYAWDQARPRMEGLTDDEYFWEPAPGCWNVRKQPNGTYMSDWAWPEPSPPPLTTIAWRLAHIGFVINMRANHRFGNRSLTPMNAPWPGSAATALDWADTGFQTYRTGIAELDDADLDRPPDGPPDYIDLRLPTAMNVQHITLELIHHAAEVSLLRDLYRVRNEPDPGSGGSGI